MKPCGFSPGMKMETHVQECRCKPAQSAIKKIGVEHMVVVAGGQDVVALNCQRIDPVRHARLRK
jgi:hypothetical protein